MHKCHLSGPIIIGVRACMRMLSYRRIMTLLAIAAALLLGGGRMTSESLFTSNMPNDYRPVVSKTKCDKLSHTWSEASTSPQSKIDRLKQQLALLGVRFALLLREDWNHVLNRNNAPMSRAQKEALDEVRQSPETVGITLARAPEAAVSEYALTGGVDDGTSRILIPISDGQQIAIVRDRFVRTDNGVVWRGTVEETGESAVMLWWKNGRLTGLFGHKGHIYTVVNMGGGRRPSSST